MVNPTTKMNMGQVLSPVNGSNILRVVILIKVRLISRRSIEWQLSTEG
jgi:hypothetical protein